ncbi:bifunctional molybdopterin-guanine dinucleotide biosynthesis adaptor protein MobB/molybdopterin molybdotransferase MoeA [Primorskyibacter sp. S87]|uniref:bifunctional molybdopterin-guanine dinucleotide biosynthesis adaptor protein MobB/molybdopterin molybdotransferase MoeA n=1 Tax=Primorskyibacter sp. S87 TaxID=3415126 RepID=UPI003C7A1989
MKIYGVTGWKNNGKTGLMERLVAELTSRGLRVSTVKHAHHAFDVDQPGRDSHRHRIAGASEVLLASRQRVALMQELRADPEPSLDELLLRLSPADLVLVEGYKREGHPKIEAHRAEAGTELIAPTDPLIRAVASDVQIDLDRPVFDLDDTVTIADFILQEVGLAPSSPLSSEGTAEVEECGPSAPPPLRNDCFALPPGVDWTPVDDALEMLRTRLSPVAGVETIPLQQALNRVLAEDAMAARPNPPQANSAVDGYGFAGAVTDGSHRLPLVDGRAAAGVPFEGAVPRGMAIRVLTGAALPDGVETVVLQEDVAVSDGYVSFRGPLKRGANARKAGEDVEAGQLVLRAGRQITPADLALMSAVGLSHIPVRKSLRVAVLSTGDELVEPGHQAGLGQIFDANRPMLLTMAQRMGFVPVDLGRVADDRETLRSVMDRAANEADVILTSGGASAGDEDHVSALLGETGALQEWRIALKPGRPVALAMWQGTPVFGLPGNPVAALVCALIFARPAMEVLAGAEWSKPQGFDLPAAFEKRKKPGRREYLRARVRDGRVEVFASEGSGRISGLSWAEGLVEIGDGACHIRPGDPVRYIPYGSFGL